MVFVDSLFFWFKNRVKKNRKMESNLTPQGIPPFSVIPTLGKGGLWPIFKFNLNF
jgi:hypothetical protein